MRSRWKALYCHLIAIWLGLFGLSTIAFLTISIPSVVRAEHPQVHFCLTVLHNNDGESQLIHAGRGLEDFGGVAGFATVLDKLRSETESGVCADITEPGAKKGVITLSAGDNFRAGPVFTAGLENGRPFFDTVALDFIHYDALAFGNHDFDFGPDVLAEFIGGFRRPVIFLSANLDFSREPSLKRLVDSGRIARSAIVHKDGEPIGVVGATTENLSIISSPRLVQINDVVSAVQTEIDILQDKGVNKIILISHLQSIQDDLALASQLGGVDIVIAGGGDELLANEGDSLIPGDEEKVFGPYPLWATGADGSKIPVVTTAGNYKYVGRLVAGFDSQGLLVMIDDERSGPVRVAGGDKPDAVLPAPLVQSLVVKPVQEAVAGLAANVIGTSQVALNGIRENVRTIETNEGNLIADGVLWQGIQLAADFGVPVPDVALLNGGGIRNDCIIPAGKITELDTFNILPFANFVSIVPDLRRDQFKEILENAVSQVEDKKGRFAQISGFRMVWNPEGKPRLLDDDGDVLQVGSRVVEVILNNGTVIVSEGAVVPGPDLNIATIDFLVRGGDQYPFRGVPFTVLGVTDQQALARYIRQPLQGVITATQYPKGGEGRIAQLIPVRVLRSAAKRAPGPEDLSIQPSLSTRYD